MHATRLTALACAATLGSALLLLSCGDDEIIVQSGGNGGAGDGAVTPRGGEASGGALHEGGAGATPSNGGSSAGKGGSGGAVASGGQAGAGGEPTLPSLGEELSFCPRLVGLSKLSLAVEEAYVDAALPDCRIAWLIPRRQELIDLRNELISWNRRFWGCEGVPVDSFPLVWGEPALSQGDANVAIEHYMTASKKELQLSPLEASEMLSALERLAAPLVEDPSLEPSKPRCGGGGEGGAGGASGDAPGGAGGAGGASSDAPGGAGGAP